MKKALITMNFIAIVFIMVFAITPIDVSAQSFTNFEDLGIKEKISVDITPSIPGPNQSVDVYVTSYMFDIDKSTISWYLNGILLEKGLGLRGISFKTGDLGQRSVLKLVIIKQTGSVLEEVIEIFPAEVDVIAEPITYTPPFYKGGSVATFQSPVKLVAVPNFIDINGRKVPDSEIVYTWNINGKVVRGKSGAGKNTYIHETDIISRPIEVILKASPVSSNQIAKVSRVIDFIQPRILIYEKNPIFGTIFEKSVQGSFTLNRQEIDFEAVPMFFDLEAMMGNYTWVVNGNNLQDQTDRDITFRRVDNNPGIASVSISIRDTKKILQAASTYFSLLYTEGRDFQF